MIKLFTSAIIGIVVGTGVLIVIWLPMNPDVKIWILRGGFLVLVLQSTVSAIRRFFIVHAGFPSTLRTLTVGISWMASLMCLIAVIDAFGTDRRALQVFLTLGDLFGAFEDFTLIVTGLMMVESIRRLGVIRPTPADERAA